MSRSGKIRPATPGAVARQRPIATRPGASRSSRGPRILAGALRGRRLLVARGVRPTESRLREALFSIWIGRLEGSRFLDLFAGSGAVGLEALSRGAQHAVFVDRAAPVLAALRRNLSLVPAAAALLRRARLPGGLDPPALAGPFDLIFADPPYRFTEHAELLRLLKGRLAAGGELVIEHSSRVEPSDASAAWRCFDRRCYGDACLSFFRPTTGE